MPEYETLMLTQRDGVARIELNRPAVRNAMNAALNAELVAALTWAAAETAVRAVLLTGAGKGFCAGADLSAFQQMPTPEQVYDAVVNTYRPMMTTIAAMPKPVIAAVNGVAAGAGAALALAADLRIMADEASLMMAFSNIGLVPDAGAGWFLTRLVGYSRAFEIAAEGQRISAARCLDLGLTNRVVPADALQEAAWAWAAQLAQRPTLALGLTKQALQQAQLQDLASTIELEARLQMQTIVSKDHLEGVMAFLQRRPAAFQGR